MKIDTSTDFGARAARRLAEEQIGWFTTVRADGMPQPVPVWFHWDGETPLIFSEPAARKVRNLAGNPRASLHFNTDDQGEDVVVLTGEARTGTEMPPPERLAAYVEKYAEGMKQLNLTPEAMLATYSMPIYLTPASVTGH
ncbi:MAG TPA: TIGR03667 family PPOX class F420-dependent oxidoreductase [Chloroflexota bacterium]|nr:TIGR03667 family PPOX class F420-dependent oxidoreductase [Chloroflexota bacterium]